MMTISALSFDALDEAIHEDCECVSASDWATFINLADAVEVQRDELLTVDFPEYRDAKLYIKTRDALAFTRLYRKYLGWMETLQARRLEGTY